VITGLKLLLTFKSDFYSIGLWSIFHWCLG